MRTLEGEAAKALMLLRSSRRPLVVTHWGMDGVASAVTASWVLTARPEIYIPPFTVELTGEVLREVRGLAQKPDLIVVLDLPYPGGALDTLESTLNAPIVVVDHHPQPEPPRSSRVVYYNPAQAGDPGGDWPSTAHTLAVMARVSVRDPLLLAASIAGDLGDAATSNRAYRAYMAMAGLNPESDYPLVRDYCVKHVNGAAATANRGALLNTLTMIIHYGEPPCEVVMKDHLLATLSVIAEAGPEAPPSRLGRRVGESGVGGRAQTGWG